MITKLTKYGKIYAFLPFLIPDDNPHDRVTLNKQNIFDKTNETGWERLKALFQKHEEYAFHPKLVNLFHTSIMSFIIGGVYGAVTTSRTTFIQFIENNEATKFDSQFHAKRELSDKMFASFIRGGASMGMKISFFCTSIMVPYVLISTYTNKEAIWYYSVGGAYAGALYKFSVGPKGMIAGGIIGCFCGTVYGTFHYFALFMIKKSEEQFQDSIFQKKLKQEEAITRSKKNMFMKEVRKDFEEQLANK